MGKKYQKKTRRSRRKVQDLDPNAVRVEIGDGQAVFQLMLPMNELLVEVAGAIEATASQAGLLMMKAMIDEEVEQLVGPRYAHDALASGGALGQSGGARDLCRAEGGHGAASGSRQGRSRKGPAALPGLSESPADAADGPGTCSATSCHTRL